MDSALQTLLEYVVMDNYSCLVIMTAMVYDHFLMFASEVEYIWNKPWTLVSTLFVIVRYGGFCVFMIDAFLGTSILPGPAKLCEVLGIISQWTFFTYICAADLVMILRVWAMYDRSKIILGILLTSYLGEIVPSTVASIVYSNPKHFVVNFLHIWDFSFCALVPMSTSWDEAANVSQLVHAGVMCTLVIIKFIISSVQMYRATKQWRLSPFINLLVMEGMAYFLAILMWNLFNNLGDFGILAAVDPQRSVPLFVVQCVPISTLTPRFILTIREMYACSVYGRRGHGIDTGFGLSALSSHGASRSSIVFADGGEREGFGSDSEEMQMERVIA